MKVLRSWLQAALPELTLSPEALAARLLLIGFEVEEIKLLGPAFSGVVIGKVLSAEKHPNADRLRVCKVSDGAAEYAVVCGAPNVAAGQTVAFARVGAKLPGGLEIKRAKIRGAESEGMICSASELGQANGKSEGILTLDPGTALGKDYAELLGGSDALMDVSVTPNRPDCLSLTGLARELRVHFALPREPRLDPPSKPFSASAAAAPEIELRDADCPRYLGRAFTGLKVGPSPAWLVRRLEALGLRSINNAVDVTNYVLLELGQPLHLFDADKLLGGKIEVRPAKAGEKIRALDGKTYELSPENLVIADQRPIAIAGVMGGEDTGTTEATTRAFLEAAHFSGGRVRKSARRLGLRTDSSTRFERGTNPALLEEAVERATSLILELCGGEAGPVRAAGAAPSRPAPIQVSSARINALLGSSFNDEEIHGVLSRIGGSPAAGGFRLEPPAHRRDLEGDQDLAEEVARHLGYDKIPDGAARVSLPERSPRDAEAEARADAEARARAVLRGLGFAEAYNYDFASTAELERYYGADLPKTLARLHNPLSADWAFLRPTLMIGLLRSAETNFNRGAEGVRLFEIGTSYRANPDGSVSERVSVSGILAGLWPAGPDWSAARREPALHDVQAAVEALARPSSVAWKADPQPGARYHPKAWLDALVRGKSAGRAGLLHPELLKRWGLRCARAAAFRLYLDVLGVPPAPRFSPFSAFPAVSRDLSILVPAGATYGEARACVEKALRADAELSARVELSDLYAGERIPEGMKSFTFRLTFSRRDRTLKDAEVAAAMERALKALAAQLGAVLR